MLLTQNRPNITKHVQFALEPRVHLINADHQTCEVSSKVTINIVPSGEIAKSTLPKHTKDQEPKIKPLKLAVTPRIIKKTESSAQKPFKSNPKYIGFLLSSTNSEDESNKCENIFSELSTIVDQSSAICNATKKQSERIRTSNLSIKSEFVFGLQHLAEPYARWLCHRQVSNAMHFWTNIHWTSTNHQHQRPGSPILPRSSRSPRPTVLTAVHTRFFKRSDGLRLV